MALNNDLSLRICTFNCRSLKNSLIDIQRLCKTHDVIFLQEHWLLPFEPYMLSEIDDDFLAFGMSAVNIDEDILRGRPYGGTATLYRKQLAKAITVVPNTEPRICAVTVTTNLGLVLCVNVYMPYDDNDISSIVEYVDICSKVSVIFSDSDAVYLAVAGDFNCAVNSRLYGAYCDFLKEEQLLCVDSQHLHDVFMYVSDDGKSTSWIDHIVCSPALLPCISEVSVLYDALSSDHRPMSACFKSLVSPSGYMTFDASNRDNGLHSNWYKASATDVYRYSSCLKLALKGINIPSYTLSCQGLCGDADHNKLIDDYYNNIVECIYVTTDRYIPKTKPYSPHAVPGWVDYAKEKHDLAR